MEKGKAITDLEKLGVKFIKRIESKPPRLLFTCNDITHPLDVYAEEGRKIRELLVKLAGTTMPTYVYFGPTKTIELTIAK